uniref:Uncharacterized protein n=1 Tax=Timema douglasi TaxID=61478 RepID=A0A7R8W078_TIMDO|nr:unnamed protein product [Timema douglasi]
MGVHRYRHSADCIQRLLPGQTRPSHLPRTPVRLRR